MFDLGEVADMHFPTHPLPAPLKTIVPKLPKRGSGGLGIVIYGNPGAMKSTFCFAMAAYLGRHFGKTCYVLGEEKGHSLTVQEKVNLVGLKKGLVTGISAKKFDEIRNIPRWFEQNGFDVAFLDSKDALNLSINETLALREDNPNTVFFFISHANNAGEIYGGKKLKHIIDLEIKNTVDDTEKDENGYSVCTVQILKTRIGGKRGDAELTMDIIEYIKSAI